MVEAGEHDQHQHGEARRPSASWPRTCWPRLVDRVSTVFQVPCWSSLAKMSPATTAVSSGSTHCAAKPSTSSARAKPLSVANRPNRVSLGGRDWPVDDHHDQDRAAATAPIRTAVARHWARSLRTSQRSGGEQGLAGAGAPRGRGRCHGAHGARVGSVVGCLRCCVGAVVGESGRLGVVGEHEEQRLQRGLGLVEREQVDAGAHQRRRRTPRPSGRGPVTTSAASGSRGRPAGRGARAAEGRGPGRRRSVAQEVAGVGRHRSAASAMVPWKATAPRFMMVTLSQISSTSSMSCELSSTVSPLRASRFTSARMSRMPAGSRPLAGSSSTSSRGSRSRLAATPSRWRMP